MYKGIIQKGSPVINKYIKIYILNSANNKFNSVIQLIEMQNYIIIYFQRKICYSLNLLDFLL